MYWIVKDFRFEAAHRLPHHDGKCQRLHGHSFVGSLYLASETLRQEGPKQGMVEDFGDCSKNLQVLLEFFLDHHDLNETTKLESPTSENLAKWIYAQLDGRIPKLFGVMVQETCTSRAWYSPKIHFAQMMFQFG